MKSATPCKTLVGAETEHQIADRRIGRKALTVLDRCDQSRGGQNFEALVDAGEEFRRNDLALDRAELDALGLLLDRTQLARRIDFEP